MLRRWAVWIALFAVALAAVPPLLIARARTTKGRRARVHLIPDMDNQPKLKAQQASALFADGRAMRSPVANTVARGELRADAHWNEGRVGDAWATTFPRPLDRPLLERGRERFMIFCAPCHGPTGYGDGPISQRADALAEGTWVPPTSFHQDDVRRRAVGEVFSFISNGVRTMPAYGPQISIADRWAIVAYVRALQRAAHATFEDVPPEARKELEQ